MRPSTKSADKSKGGYDVFFIYAFLNLLADFISQIGISESGYKENSKLCRFISQCARYGSTSYPRAHYFTILHSKIISRFAAANIEILSTHACVENTRRITSKFSQIRRKTFAKCKYIC